MEQNLLHQGKLLDENGNLTEAGYHYRLVKEYLSFTVVML